MKCKCGGKLIRSNLNTYECTLCGLKSKVAFAYVQTPMSNAINNQQYLDKVQEKIINAFKIPADFLEKKELPLRNTNEKAVIK